MSRTCFVIQPFDAGAYDRRYDEILVPAIKEAGLEPYRVDRNPATDVPADEIENGIRRASACVADVSTDNPNVWYEVGYAYACRKRVCLISEKRPTPRPFDIRNRAVIEYAAGAEAVLRERIAARLKAIVLEESAIRCEGLAIHLKQISMEGQITDPPYESSYRFENARIIRSGDACTLTADLKMTLADFTLIGSFVAQGVMRAAYCYAPYHIEDSQRRQSLNGALVLHCPGVGDLTGFWLSESFLMPGTLAFGRVHLRRTEAD